jgi:lipoprotein Spr
MRILMSIILLITACAGCSVDPRLKAGEEESGIVKIDRTYDREFQGDEFEGTTTEELLELGRIIQRYLGTPYNGKSEYAKGMDCSQFTRTVFREFNDIRLPRTAREQYRIGHNIGRDYLRYGDLVFFKTNGETISHVGIYVGYNEFAHASSSSGVIISSLNEKYWKRRLIGGRRIIP